MKRRFLSGILICAAVFGPVTLVSTQAAAPRRPCDVDVKRFCKKAMSPPDTLKCLRKHQSELSKTCSDAFDRSQDRMREACGEPIEKYCASSDSGGEPLALCLSKHIREPSFPPDCRAVLASLRKSPIFTPVKASPKAAGKAPAKKKSDQ